MTKQGIIHTIKEIKIWPNDKTKLFTFLENFSTIIIWKAKLIAQIINNKSPNWSLKDSLIQNTYKPINVKPTAKYTFSVFFLPKNKEIIGTITI